MYNVSKISRNMVKHYNILINLNWVGTGNYDSSMICLPACVPGTLYGDKERNCSMFYDCVSGIRRPCPALTLFAEDKGVCMSKPTVNKSSCVIKKNRGKLLTLCRNKTDRKAQ